MSDGSANRGGRRADRDLDVVVLGATSLTGRLAARRLLVGKTAGEPVRWAVSGRSPARLRQVLKDLGANDTEVEADTNDPSSLAVLARRTAVVASFVGPYTGPRAGGARADPDDLRTGCLTPALALGVAGAGALDSDGLHLR